MARRAPRAAARRALIRAVAILAAVVPVLATGVVAIGLAGCERARPRVGETVSVHVELAGATPAEIEAMVVGRVEEAVGALPGVVSLRSVSRTGVGRVDIAFKAGIDSLTARARVSEALGKVRERLPVAASVPMITAARPATWIYARVPDRPEIAEEIRRQAQMVPGVVAVEECGVREAVVSIELVPQRLAAAGVTAQEVVDVVTAENVDVSAGRIEAAGQEVLIRTVGELESFDAVATLPVGQNGVRLRDVGAITERSETDCVVVGGEKVGALMRVGLHLAKDEKPVIKALKEAGAQVIAGPVRVRDHAMPGAVHERAAGVRGEIERGGDGWFAVVPRAGQHVQLVVAGKDPWKGAPTLQAVLVGDDLEALIKHAAAGLDALRGSPEVAHAEQRGAATGPELRLEPDRNRAAQLGLDVATIARALQVAHGERVGSYVRSARRAQVVVTIDGGPANWADINVRGNAGALIPLSQVVTATTSVGPAEILRLDRRRAVVLWAQARSGTSASRLRQVLAAALPGAQIGPAEPRNLADDHW